LSLKVEAVREATEEEVGQGTLGTGFFKLEADTSLLTGHKTGNHTLH
jgi:FKBP-type peptidyl-prolyl cis-trans isomerase SlyD